MKKIILIMLIMLMPMGATYATTMCAANDTVAIVLDPSIMMKGDNNDATLKIWRTWGAIWDHTWYICMFECGGS